MRPHYGKANWYTNEVEEYVMNLSLTMRCEIKLGAIERCHSLGRVPTF